MNEISLGNLIRKERESQGLSQEQLCEGICEPMTLSRLETGKCIPAMHRLRALLQRLGLPEEKAYALVGDKELRFSALEKELNRLHIHFERSDGADGAALREEAQKIYSQLEALTDGKDRIAQQIILRSKYLLGTDKGPYGLEDGLKLLTEALRLTVPRFDLEHITGGLYMENEVRLINSVALCYLRNGEHRKAVEILAQLFRHMERQAQKTSQTRSLLPMVAFNYARELCAVKRYEESVETAMRGKEISIDYGYYLFLPDLLAVLAECYYFLNEPDKSALFYQQANLLYKIVENEHDQKTIQAEAKERLGLELT